MSREIKFRAWHETDKCWYNPRFIEMNLLGQAMLRGAVGLFEIIPASAIEQYTGLKDKNGKEIYEGDIVKWLDGLGEYTNFVVEWQENRARFCLRNEYSHYDYEDINDKKKPYIEVIGNIHESNMEEMAKERKKTNGQIEKD